MKKVTLSIVSMLAASGFAFAGGNIDQVEEPEVTEVLTVDESTFYVGIGYGNTVHEHDIYSVDLDRQTKAFDEKFHSLFLQGGYQFNVYISLEGRYWFGFDNKFMVKEFKERTVESSIDTWAIYLKPMYPVTDNINIYALIGYAGTKHDVNGDPQVPEVVVGDSYDGFSWGLGASYSLLDNISVFVDYVNIYDDEKSWTHPKGGWEKVSDEKIDIWNIGISYRF